MVNAHISLDRRRVYQLYLEGQPRIGNDWQRAATFQARTALVYNIDSALGLYAGYAWTPQLYDSKYHHDYRDEQRFWQQISYRHGLMNMKWLHRIREEQRMQMRTEGVAHRVRYMLRGAHAFSNTEDFGLAFFNEVMINLNTVVGGAQSGYDRNRFFIGPYWVVGSAHYELGYLAEHLKRFGAEERWAHALVCAIMLQF